MNTEISYFRKNALLHHKLLISILFGILGLLFSPFGIVIIWDTVTIDLPWSILFPLLASMAYGHRYGIIAGISGGALFPFLLWPDNGWANLGTSLCFIAIYALLGLAVEPFVEKKIPSKNLRIITALSIGILLFGFYFKFGFNAALSINPTFWQKTTIEYIDPKFLFGFFYKDSINLIAFALIVETLLKTPLVCKLLGLPVFPNMKANGKIFISTLAISILAWLVYVGLGKTLLRGINTLQTEHITLALLVIVTSGIIAAQILILYSENQFNIQIKLNASERSFRKSIEFNPVPISITKLNGELVYNNKQFIDTFGYTIQDIPTLEKWFFLAYPDNEYRVKVEAEWNELVNYAIENDVPTPIREFFITCKNGEIKTVEISCYFEEEIAVSSFQDITERKKTEQEIINAKDIAEENQKILLAKNDEYEALNEELRQTNEELFYAKEKAEESDRLKSSFLLNMSHEVRTPMNSINGFSKLLASPNLSDEKRKNFTSFIINSSKQLQSIVDDILTISALETKQEIVRNETVSINSMLAELIAIFKIQAHNKQISLFVKPQLTDKQSEIYIDKAKLKQIFTNLIGNAIKFTHRGLVEFGYRILETHGHASLPELQFYVKDTGIGIKPEMHSLIFDRFVQVETGTTRQYGGNGLGLTISKGFVELLGGKIWVESEFDKGSTFYFNMPYNPVNVSDKPLVQTIKNNHLKTILIAEDETYNYFFIEELLTPNFTLIRTKDGKETVEICKSNPNIDLVLMDIKMPIMDGNAAAKEIKEFRPELIIIAQSAYTLEQYKDKYRDNIFDDYIAKPINIAELKQKVSKYFDV